MLVELMVAIVLSADPAPFVVFGKPANADRVRKAGQKFAPSLILKPTEKVVGKIVKIEGLWQQNDDGDAFLVVAGVGGKRPTAIPLGMSRFEDYKLRNDVVVTVYGPILEPGGMDAWLIDVAPPGLRWACSLQNPGTVIAGERQTYTVDVVLKNTGQQGFVAVTGAVRIWQVESPNDVVKEVVFESVAPGETRTVSVPIELYNYSVIGKTSVPQCAFTVVEFE